MMQITLTDQERITALISLYRAQIIRFLMDRYAVSEHEAEMLERQLNEQMAA